MLESLYLSDSVHAARVVVCQKSEYALLSRIRDLCNGFVGNESVFQIHMLRRAFKATISNKSYVAGLTSKRSSKFY